MQPLKLTREWEGETVFIVAGGTSVLAQDTEALRGRKVIAVNSSYERVPFAQFVFFSDDRWWQEHRKRPALALCVANGAKLVTVSKAAVELPHGLPLHKMRRVCPNMREARRALGPGYAEDPGALVAQRTSLQGAMNMAGHLGAACIVLLGADMGRGPDGKTHHHAPHKWANKEGNRTWDIQMRQLALIVAPLQARGIRVINTSTVSRIPWWTKAPLEAVLNGDEIKCEVVMPTLPAPTANQPTGLKPKKGNPGGIMQDDESTLRALVTRYKIGSLLEFGPGASTRIWLSAGVRRIVSCEHNAAWFGKAKALYAADKRVTLLSYANEAEVPTPWTGDTPHFDAAFVDSPQAYKPEHLRDGKARFNTLRLALASAPIVFLHDAKRPGEQASLAALQAEGYTVEMVNTYKGVAVIRKATP